MILGVFCGGATGNTPLYANAAGDLGRTLAQRGIEIVYGGGREGLMGALADGALAEGGRITGVMPRAFAEQGCMHTGLSRLEVVETPQERKEFVARLADGFVTLPGGPGTFDEMFEQWTAGQLGLHRKPCGFLNVAGFFEPLKAIAHTAIGAGFLRQEYADMLVFEDRPDELVRRFGDYVPPPPKWSQAKGGGAEAP